MSISTELAYSEDGGLLLRTTPGGSVSLVLDHEPSIVETDLEGGEVEVLRVKSIEVTEIGYITSPWSFSHVEEDLWAVSPDIDSGPVLIGRVYETSGLLRIGEVLVIPPGVIIDSVVVARFVGGEQNFTLAERDGAMWLKLAEYEDELRGVWENQTKSWLFLSPDGLHVFRLAGEALGKYVTLPVHEVSDYTWLSNITDLGTTVLVRVLNNATIDVFFSEKSIPLDRELRVSPAQGLQALKLAEEDFIRLVRGRTRDSWLVLLTIPSNATVKDYKLIVDQAEYTLRLVLPSSDVTVKYPEGPLTSGSYLSLQLSITSSGDLLVTATCDNPPLTVTAKLSNVRPGALPISIMTPYSAKRLSGKLALSVSLNETLAYSAVRTLGFSPSLQLLSLNGTNIYAIGERNRVVLELVNRGPRDVLLLEVGLLRDSATVEVSEPLNQSMAPGSISLVDFRLDLPEGVFIFTPRAAVLDPAFNEVVEISGEPLSVVSAESPMIWRLEVPAGALPLVPFNITLVLTSNIPASNVVVTIVPSEPLEPLGTTSVTLDAIKPGTTATLSFPVVAERPGTSKVELAVSYTAPWGPEEMVELVNVSVGFLTNLYSVVGPATAASGDTLNLTLEVGGPPGFVRVFMPPEFEVVETNATLGANNTITFEAPGRVYIKVVVRAEPGVYLVPSLITVNNSLIPGDPLRLQVTSRPSLSKEELITKLTELRRRVRSLKERGILPWVSPPQGISELEEALRSAESLIEEGRLTEAKESLEEVELALNEIEGRRTAELDPLIPVTLTLLVSAILLAIAGARWREIE